MNFAHLLWHSFSLISCSQKLLKARLVRAMPDVLSMDEVEIFLVSLFSISAIILFLVDLQVCLSGGGSEIQIHFKQFGYMYIYVVVLRLYMQL